MSVGKTVVKKHFCHATFFAASFFDAVLMFWILSLSQCSWLLMVLPTSPVATGGKQPVHSSAGRAANIIGKNQGLEHSLVSSLNDYEK